MSEMENKGPRVNIVMTKITVLFVSYCILLLSERSNALTLM